MINEVLEVVQWAALSIALVLLMAWVEEEYPRWTGDPEDKE